MKTNKKELTVFALCAYAIPFLMMPLLYICQQNGRDTSILPTPRCSTRQRALCWRFCWQDGRGRQSGLHPAHRGHCADARHERSVCVPAAGGLAEYCKLCHHYRVGAGLDLPADREKTKREDYGLRLHGKLLTALVICVYFLAVKTAMVFLSMAMQGGDSWAEYLAYWRTSAPWVMAVVLVPNFFLSFLPFFGEEYGWRYYLTPALQGRFGARRGALAVGVLWGLWHLPLNLFFYSPDTSLQSIAAQLVVCVTLGVFFTFAYEKCGKNIWLPVVLHYLNNSMVLVWTGTADISNQIIGWGDVASAAVQYAIVFLPFLAAKCFKKAE